MGRETDIVVKKLRGATARSARRLALKTLSNLITATPVDTGHARSNWVPSIGTPHVGIEGSKESVSTSAQAAGIDKVRRFRLENGEIHLSNNVPYLAILNQGSSQQAPAGFVEDAIARARAAEAVIRDLEKAVESL